MFDSASRKILIGLATTTLLSTTMSSVWAEEAGAQDSHHLITSEGQPVLSTREGECIQTPVTPNDPRLAFKECGDIGDRDGDGIADDDDACPDNTPEEISKGVYSKENPPKNDCDKIGCPIDTDGDGVPDYADKCADTAAEYMVSPPACTRHQCVDSTGCTGGDEDGDGVTNCEDQCPGTPAGTEVNSIGCAAGQEKRTEKETLSSEVLFDFDKFNLKAEGKRELDRIANAIVGEGEYFSTLQVIGHTDSIGTDKYNQTLSEKRARSVAQYLISKGIAANKVSEEGRGEKEPIASNKTSAGRQQNRRVEINYGLFRQGEGQSQRIE
jgi:OOP family OmpA-OmpF porin